MENTGKIVFLYAASSVPDRIVAAALAQTPEGFELVPCEAATPAAERRAMSPTRTT